MCAACSLLFLKTKGRKRQTNRPKEDEREEKKTGKEEGEYRRKRASQIDRLTDRPTDGLRRLRWTDGDTGENTT